MRQGDFLANCVDAEACQRPFHTGCGRERHFVKVLGEEIKAPGLQKNRSRGPVEKDRESEITAHMDWSRVKGG